MGGNKVFIFFISDVSTRVPNLFLIVTMYRLLISQLVSDNFSMQISTQMSIDYLDRYILVLVHYGNTYVLVRI